MVGQTSIVVLENKMLDGRVGGFFEMHCWIDGKIYIQC
jgi:hypothetical protein